jgi:hypothetical protein
MKSQKTGLRTKRFFVLRDNVLTYHKSKPTVNVDDEMDLESSCGRVTLTENSTIARGRYLLTPCFTITTPYDTLWMKIKGDVDEQERWMDQIRLAIAQSAKKQLFSTKERVESIWHHESPNFNCIAVDAVVRYAFHRKTYRSVALFSNNDKQYSVDISKGDSADSERYQFEVRSLLTQGC